jgi:hypothetical protein
MSSYFELQVFKDWFRIFKIHFGFFQRHANVETVGAPRSSSCVRTGGGCTRPKLPTADEFRMAT